MIGADETIKLSHIILIIYQIILKSKCCKTFLPNFLIQSLMRKMNNYLRCKNHAIFKRKTNFFSRLSSSPFVLRHSVRQSKSTLSVSVFLFFLRSSSASILSVLIYDCFINGPFLASFSLFYPFQYTKQINVRYWCLPMTGFESRTSGVGSFCSTNWATTTAKSLIVNLQYFFSIPFLCSFVCLSFCQVVFSAFRYYFLSISFQFFKPDSH